MGTTFDNALDLLGLRVRRKTEVTARSLIAEVEQMKERHDEQREKMRELQRDLEDTIARLRTFAEKHAAATKWDEAFARTTDAEVDQMIENAKRDVAKNGTISLDELKASL